LPANANAHEHGRYAHEKTDAGVRNVAALAAAFVGLLVFGVIVAYGTFRFMYTPETATEVPSALQPGRVLPPAPRLQVNAQEDLRDYLQQQKQTLNSYGWVDQSAGVVRIPIDRAMDLVIQKGLPTRVAAGGPTSGGAKHSAGRPPVASATSAIQAAVPSTRPAEEIGNK
jgi:hypothetical protein